LANPHFLQSFIVSLPKRGRKIFSLDLYTQG